MTYKEEVLSQIEDLRNIHEQTSHLNEDAFNSGMYKGLTSAINIIKSTSIWHDVSDEPEKDVSSVICTNGKAIWMATIDEYSIAATKWAYIEDILPDYKESTKSKNY